MTELGKAISLVRSRLEKHSKSRNMNEQNTKAILIEPILRALGWDVEDLDDVVHEYRRKKQDNPVDYAMMVMRTPKLFLEAKSLRKNLDDEKWAKQTLGYATVTGVQWVVLSNGDEYRIYNSHAVVPVEKKLFHRVRISDPDSRPEEVLSLISKDELQEKTIDILWNAHFVDRQVRRVIEELFQGDPDKALIELIKHVSSDLQTDEIFASLQRATVSVDYPEYVRKPTDLRKLVPQEKPGTVATGRHGVSLGKIISRGLLEVPCTIYAIYKGVEVTARIESADRVVFQGEDYRSLSTAGTAARKHVLKLPEGEPVPNRNGWLFWEYRDEDKRIKLDELRK